MSGSLTVACSETFAVNRNPSNVAIHCDPLSGDSIEIEGGSLSGTVVVVVDGAVVVVVVAEGRVVVVGDCVVDVVGAVVVVVDSVVVAELSPSAWP